MCFCVTAKSWIMPTYGTLIHASTPSCPAGDLEHVHVVAAEAFRFVTERDHVAGLGVDLRVRGEGLARQLAVERVDGIERLERVQVQRDRRAVFLQREQQVLVLDDVRVGGAAAQPLHARIVQ